MTENVQWHIIAVSIMDGVAMFFYEEEIENKMPAEIMANRILDSAGVAYNNVPIDIDKVLLNYEFKIGVVRKFDNESIVAGIAYTEKEQKQLKSKKFFVFKGGIPIRDRRYLMALSIVEFVVESKNNYFVKSIYNSALNDENEINNENARVARALLMPQKSLSTLVMSPMINKLDVQEKIDSVAKAFLVSNDIARRRLIETGLL